MIIFFSALSKYRIVFFLVAPSLSSDGGKAEDDDLASLPGNETTFSPSSSDQRVLSSTRANLSLTRGSLSR